MERHLAAVLIADVVGYGRLSQIDEEGTRACFQSDLKEVFEPGIAAHHGRLVKTMGDGILVEFHSVVDAVRCAVAIQQQEAERNALLPPERRLDFRIGVNLGDIIMEGDDIHGDGVNIADRLQGLAEPGGIAISGTAYDHVKGKLPIGFTSLGEQKVKSIAEPIRVYRVVLDPAVAGKTLEPRKNHRSWRVPAGAAAVIALLLAGATAWWQPWRMAGEQSNVRNVVAADTRPSLVVLPFDNLSDDKQQGYLADGITEDLTTELARLPGLFVVSRNAAFTYKDKAIQPAQIAVELGVRYILEGSIRRAGDQMRINAQLIDATTSGHMWAERFDGAWSEVFALQDKMVGEIATALKLRLVTIQRVAQIAGGTSNAAAYEALLRGLEHKYRDTPTDIAEAVKLYQQALALDPNFGRAWAELAWVYWDLHSPEQDQAVGIAWEDVMVKLDECLQQAAKHPSPTYYQIVASLLLRQQKSDDAIAALEKAISLDASDPWNYDDMSQALVFNGRPSEGRGYIDVAMRVEPGWTAWRSYVAGLTHFSMERFQEAAASLEKIDTQPIMHWAIFYGLIVRMAAYGHLERPADIAGVEEKLKRLLIERGDNREFSGLFVRNYFPFKNYADTERLLAGLRKAGVPDLPFGLDAKSGDRLSGDEIKALLFGHQIQGRRPATGEPYLRTTSANGVSTISVGAYSDQGASWMEGDTICTWADARGRYCAAIFRNPAGNLEGRNEYFWINAGNRNEFSVVK